MAKAVSRQLVTVPVLLAGWDAHAQRRVLLVSMATAVQSGVLVLTAVPVITWPARARVPPDGRGTSAHDAAPLVSMATSAPGSVNAVETTSNIVITWLGVVVVRMVMLAWGKGTKGIGCYSQKALRHTFATYEVKRSTKSNVSSEGSSSERNRKKKNERKDHSLENPVCLWRRAFARNVRLRFLALGRRVAVSGETNDPPLLGDGCEPQGVELLLISSAAWRDNVRKY